MNPPSEFNHPTKRVLHHPPAALTGYVRSIGLPCLLAMFFSAMQIRYSMSHGRLASTPIYDDVTYLRDGAYRLDSFYQNGLAGLARDYMAHPPHSPFSSLMAMVGFLLFGIKDWAAYAMNTLVVCVFLACSARLMRGCGFFATLAALLLLLTLPLSANMIVEFRPDFACGLAAAIAVLIPLRRPLLTASVSYRLTAGLWFAIALLCKTSAFPLTMMTVLLAWSLSTICDRLSFGAEADLKKCLAVWIQMLIPPAMLALPFYLINLRQIISYIWINIFSERREHWARTGTLWFHASYYITGEAGQFVLKWHLFLLLIPLAIAAALMLGSYTKDAASLDRLRRATALGLTLLLSLAVPTLSIVKSPFFGAEAQTLLVLGSLLSLGMMMRGEQGFRGKSVARIVLGCLLLMGLGLFGFSNSPADPSDPHVRATNRVVSSIAALVTEHTPVRGKVVLTSWGIALNDAAIGYLAAKDNKQLNTTELPDNAVLADFAQAFQVNDTVIAAEPMVWEFFGNLPSYAMLGQTLDLIRNDDNFALAGTVASEGGPRFFVYYRQPLFSDWTFSRNLGFVEGPYPQWHLPVVRWGSNDQTVLRFNSPGGGPYRLSLSAEASVDGQSLSYLIDGKPIADRRDVFPLGSLRSYLLHFTVPAGEHEITLKYGRTAEASHATDGHVLLYHRLRLAAEAEVRE